MKTMTLTVRIVPCDCTKGPNGTPLLATRDCLACRGRGQVVATSERLLVGLTLQWDAFR